MLLEPEHKLAPIPEDDVESLFLVLVYAVTRALACSDRMERIYSRSNSVPDEEIQERKHQLGAFFEQHWGWGTTDLRDLSTSRFDGRFFVELIQSDPYHAVIRKVARWFAVTVPGEPALVSPHVVKGILYQFVRKFIDAEMFDVGLDYSDPDEDEDNLKAAVLPPLGLTGRKLFTHDEVIEVFKNAIARLERREMR
ncbi:hypothetical protein GSI_03760 [Ganoderma sinense ZZ0214-1]|uniref:Uncharacterized protein n=1 Tax=Ganoderma sinense ZZ0214-1 TaxID=1077348 RepID=A0A2G8SJU7_9APHY|nr:hypothetical protein GSI_03760 [Ganoderma sinense ZZ0214-1]